MAKHGESEGDVLSKDEMKSTKGGAGAAASAEAGMRKRLAVDETLVDTSLQAEALSAIPTGRPAVSVNEPPPPPPIVGKN
jgi:hypothetical protein